MVKGTTSMGGFTKKKFTSDVEDVVKTHYTNVITNVQVVDSQRPKEENILDQMVYIDARNCSYS